MLLMEQEIIEIKGQLSVRFMLTLNASSHSFSEVFDLQNFALIDKVHAESI